MFYATNKTREKYKKTPLKVSEAITKGASLWAAIMAKEGFVGHFHETRSDIKTPGLRMKIFDANEFVSENCNSLMSGKTTYKDLAARAIQNWLNSPGHKRNMLNNKWQYLGCGSGIRKQSDSTEIFYVYFVQNFH